MTISIPKFNFNNNTIKTDKELNEKLEATGGNQKYLNAGKHNVTIIAAEYTGPAKDERWGQFKITYEGTGGKTAQEWLMVPFQDVHYKGQSGKETLFPFKKVQSFVSVLGGNLTVASLQDTLTTLFSNPTKSLVGKKLSITVGYEGNHVDYKSKDQYVIMMKDNSTLADQTGASLIFTSRDAAVEYCEQQNIAVEKYTRVLSYDAAPGGTRLTSASNW